MSNFIVNTDIPNLRVVIREGDQYNINIVPGRITTLVTGSFTSYADMAGMAASASYVSGAGVFAQFATSASYAVTSSYADANLLTASVAGNILTFTKGNNQSFSVTLSTGSVDSASFTTTASFAQTAETINFATVTQSSYFEIPFVSGSKLATDGDVKITFNPATHQLRISGGLGPTAGNVRIDTTGVVISSGSTHTSGLNKDGVFTSMDGREIGLVGWPSQITSRPGFATHDNPAIFVTSGSTDYTAYIPMEFQGSGSYTDGRVTVNTPLVAKQGAEVTGSVTATEFVKSNEYKLNAGTVSIIFTGSINTGIFGTTEYIYPYISTTQYSGMTVEYLAQRPGACRMGIIMASWLNTASVTFTDISTTDIGDTSDITFRFLSSSNELRLRVNSDGSGSGAWTVQSLFKLFPNLTP